MSIGEHGVQVCQEWVKRRMRLSTSRQYFLREDEIDWTKDEPGVCSKQRSPEECSRSG